MGWWWVGGWADGWVGGRARAWRCVGVGGRVDGWAAWLCSRGGRVALRRGTSGIDNRDRPARNPPPHVQHSPHQTLQPLGEMGRHGPAGGSAGRAARVPRPAGGKPAAHVRALCPLVRMLLSLRRSLSRDLCWTSPQCHRTHVPTELMSELIPLALPRSRWLRPAQYERARRGGARAGRQNCAINVKTARPSNPRGAAESDIW